MVNLTIVAPRQAPGLTLTNMIPTYYVFVLDANSCGQQTVKTPKGFSLGRHQWYEEVLFTELGSGMLTIKIQGLGE